MKLIILTAIILGAASRVCTAGVVLYGFDESTDQLLSINPWTGAGTVVGPLPFGRIGDVAIDASGQAFGTKYDTDDLVSIDLTSGAATIIGPLGFGLVNGLAYDSAGTLYGMDDGTDRIVQIDTSTGAATAVSPALGVTNVIGIAFDSSDTLFAADSVDGNLLVVDPATGSHTVVGSFGLGVGTEMGSLAFDASGTLFGAEKGATDQLYTIDTTTGLATAVGPLGFTRVTAIAFSTASVPEPATLTVWALLAAVIGTLRLRRFRDAMSGRSQ